MKRLLVAAALLVPTAALALQGPLTTRMSCAEVQATVARHGGIVLNFSADTYDRIVRDQRWCMPTEGLVQSFVPARDNPHCFAGYTCREGWNTDHW